MNRKIEFIEEYIKVGNSDYKWNDNHGELVRCKDCKHRQENACDYSAVWVRPNGFCQWGERRDE